MSSLMDMMDRYAATVDNQVWEALTLRLMNYERNIRKFSDVRTRFREFEIDGILCPELFFCAFLDVLIGAEAHGKKNVICSSSQKEEKDGKAQASQEEAVNLSDEEFEDAEEEIQELFDDNDLVEEDLDYGDEFLLSPPYDEWAGIAAEIYDTLPPDFISIMIDQLPKRYPLARIPVIDSDEKLRDYGREYAAYLGRRLASKGCDFEFVTKLKEYFSDPLSWEKKHRKNAEHRLDEGGTCESIDLVHVLIFSYEHICRVEESRSRWSKEDLSFVTMAERVAGLRKSLSEEVICQDSAIRKFVQGMFNSVICDRESIEGPEASFLFVGPPGVGKTFLAKTAAKYLGRPVKIFQMNEYAEKSSHQGLIGIERMWKNSQPGLLTAFVKQNKNAVLVFDEVEKAHINTIRLFLSILEGGTLQDVYYQEDIDFTHTVVIFTTNAGRKFYEEQRDIPLSSVAEITLLDALKDDKYNEEDSRIPSEILSRMAKGNIIAFDHMDPVKLVPVVKKGLAEGSREVMDIMDVKCEFDESLLPYLFLYHMGAKLDARIASARSKSFIKDSIFKVAERVADNKSDMRLLKKKDKKLRFLLTVKDSPLAKELTEPAGQACIIIVCNQADYNNLVERKTERYKLYHAHAETDKSDYRKYIKGQLKDHEISAILVDPFMRENKAGGNGGMEGLSNKDSKGMEVISWLLSQKGLPPVYCLEMRKGLPIKSADQMDLLNRGIKDIIRLSEAGNKKERTNLINELAYELFLKTKLDSLIRKGKILDFETGLKICDDAPSESGEEKGEDAQKELTIELVVHQLRLVDAMDPESSEIFIPEEMRKAGGFDSVIGAEGAKEELRHFLDFIREPEKYRKSGRQVSRGLLLYGPPGTGKTKLARALACEADCPFISVTGSELMTDSRRVKDIFFQARKYAPSVVFIDEIEAIAQSGSNPVLKALLTEMEGFSGTERPVFVIAATNAGDAPNLGRQNIYLDPALLRRFTKSVYMKLPSREDRIAFMLQKKKQQEGMTYNYEKLTKKDIEKFADLMAGRSLAVMENVLAMAIGRAAENGVNVSLGLLTTCFEEMAYGEEHKYSEEHIRMTAIHEAGHAFVGFVCDEGANSRFMPEYATIIARGGYLGLVRQKDDETLSGYSKPELLKLMRISLAGRAAELVFSGENEDGLTTGASNDLENATYIAEGMVSRFGMEEGFLVSMPVQIMMQSALASRYYEKLNEILTRELEETIRIIEKNRKKVEKLANALLEKSRLDTGEMKEILGIKD